eukprot:6188645-Pleurochrysis_carterae.AAC.2
MMVPVGNALLSLILVESIALVTMVSLPVAYGLSRIEGDQTWRSVFPFAAGVLRGYSGNRNWSATHSRVRASSPST